MLQRSYLFLLFYSSLHSVSIHWQSQVGELGFFVEVPPEYRKTYSLRPNGVILSFVYENAAIEVRSFQDEKYANYSYPELVDLKAARLSALYNGVRLLYEKPSFYRQNMYVAAWELVHEGVRYIEQNAFIKNGAQIVTISCVAPAKNLSRYQVAFENAIFSLTLDTATEKISQYLRLKSLILYNRPNREGEAPVEVPSKEKKSDKSPPPAPPKEPIVPQKEVVPEKKQEDIDSFLPPLK
ncbi:MAG: hypothetical protein NZM25_09265 [Leptospiraceae bacterium]|nr:hypothetical protein [Leptospiraceae bacterium]MDW8307328.1 hypothetical protein [Leptospiraceae bacterium]